MGHGSEKSSLLDGAEEAYLTACFFKSFARAVAAHEQDQSTNHWHKYQQGENDGDHRMIEGGGEAHDGNGGKQHHYQKRDEKGRVDGGATVLCGSEGNR